MANSQRAADAWNPTPATWAAPVGLAAIFALYNLFLAPIHGPPPSGNWKWLSMLGIGVVFAQPLLAAAWAALGPGTLIYRLPISAATLIVWIFAHSFAELNLFASEAAMSRVNIQMAVAFVILFAVAATAIGLVRRASGIRVLAGEQSSAGVLLGGNQFGVKYLLGWMTVCALLIVIGKSMSFDFWRSSTRTWLSELAEFAAAVALFLLLLIPPTVLPLMALTRPTPRRSLLAICVSWPLSFWAAAEIIKSISRGGGGPTIGECAILQIGAAIATLFSAIVLRCAGFHLTSAADPASPLPSAEPLR